MAFNKVDIDAISVACTIISYNIKIHRVFRAMPWECAIDVLDDMDNEYGTKHIEYDQFNTVMDVLGFPKEGTKNDDSDYVMVREPFREMYWDKAMEVTGWPVDETAMQLIVDLMHELDIYTGKVKYIAPE